MPFAAVRRHQFWSVDVRSIEDHALATGKPTYVVSILETFSRAILASAISPRQDLTVENGSFTYDGLTGSSLVCYVVSGTAGA